MAVRAELVVGVEDCAAAAALAERAMEAEGSAAVGGELAVRVEDSTAAALAGRAAGAGGSAAAVAAAVRVEAAEASDIALAERGPSPSARKHAGSEAQEDTDAGVAATWPGSPGVAGGVARGGGSSGVPPEEAEPSEQLGLWRAGRCVVPCRRLQGSQLGRSPACLRRNLFAMPAYPGPPRHRST